MKKDIERLTCKYITPNVWRSASEIMLTLSLLLLGLIASCYALKHATWLLFIITIPVALLFSRIFILQHELSHGSLFKKKKHNDIIGVLLSVLILSPYHYWRKAHIIHHVNGGNADSRPWVGDIDVLTVEEYRKKSKLQKLSYQIYRNPFVMFLLGSIYIFLIDHRYFHKRKGFRKNEAQSVFYTNIAVILFYGFIIWLIGLKAYLIVILLPQWLGGAFGIYLFYIQHNFRDRYFVPAKDWSLRDSALKGSTYYDFPQPLKWFTANIGYHHIHTLMPKIPFYRLPQCHMENRDLHCAPTFGLRDMPKMLSLKLYNEETCKMISWEEFKSMP